ncbi:MAG: hypothetical protein JST42_02190 [Bacteroidetes bacterium]|nr:hypothetical protein [Bacteroidota bacterium]
MSPLYPHGRNRTVLVFTVVLLSFAAEAQNTLDRLGLSAGVSASAAYSVRLLSTGYAGKALQVRRSSDNTVQDIGFTAAGDLDTAALLSFVGTGSGFITAWYDQSGNGLNLTQTTAANEATLVSSGVIQRENTRPFIRFYGYPHTGYNSINLAAAMTTVGHVSSVMKFAAGGYGFILSSFGTYNWHSDPGNFLINSASGLGSTSVHTGLGWSNGSSMAPTAIPWPTTLTLEELEPATPSSGTDWNNIGSDRGSCCHELSGGGGYSELVLFAAALSTTSRQASENNQMAYYGMGTLPVTWQSFTARLNNGNVDLRWETSLEQASKTFAVERSTNGHDWSKIGSVAAAGSSAGPLSYSYIDYAPLPGGNYYRVAETDIDGKSSYSTVAYVQTGDGSDGFRVLHNPVMTGQIEVMVNRPMLLSLYGMDGVRVWQRRCSAGLVQVPVSTLTRGLYLLSGETVTVKVLVE